MASGSAGGLLRYNPWDLTPSSREYSGGGRDRQGLTDSPTYHCRDQSLPPCILVFQEKVTRMFGFNYSFFLSRSCQGGKEKQTAA